MSRNWFVRSCVLAALAAWMGFGSAWGATFGTVVSIGGQASDIALDEARGVLYIANFGANRIEVMSTADNTIRTSINVAPQPGSLALSPDGQFLLVAHFGNFQAPNSPANALSVINLNSNAKQTFALGSPPLGVAFGIDGRALIVTTTDFTLFDPVSGATQVVDTIAGVTAKTLPVPPNNFPPQIIAASVAASGDGQSIFGLSDTIRFRYDVTTRHVYSLGYQSSPPMGPRVVTATKNGSYYAAGWGLYEATGALWAQFSNPAGLLNVGSLAIDSAAGVIYAQVPEAGAQPVSPIAPGAPAAPSPAPSAPVMTIVDADNLAVRERLQLSENLAGKSILSSAADMLYSVSDSGVLVMPVGALNQAHRVKVAQEDVAFRGNFCDRRVASQVIDVVDPGGGNTDFTLSTSTPGIIISPAAGVTPARVTISIDPSIFQNQKGTVTASINIKSAGAVNLPDSIRVLINTREPDQRGTFINVPGKLADILADPARNRFYVLRQDKNQLLVFDGSTYNQIAALRTSNTPTQMAITFDRKYLLVGHDNAQIAHVYDLDTLERQSPVRFPGSHYPKSIAASGRSILASCRVAFGSSHMIDRIDIAGRTAAPLASLGVFENNVNLNTVLVASPNGSSILVAMADGGVMLYDANADTFTVSRKDFPGLSGAYAASSFDQYMVGNALLNSSLVPVKRLETSTGVSSGFAFVDQSAFRTTVAVGSAPSGASSSPASGGAASPAGGPGVIQRVDVSRGDSIRPTRLAEAPLMGTASSAFTRTLAPLYDRSALISLTTSGFTVLSWNYDAAVAPPRIDRIVNAADFTQPVAPGGLITVFGDQLSPVNIATREIPLPTALGESCLTVNGVPVPMIFVSSNQINAQLPFNVDGNATMILRTPGGVSDNYLTTIYPAAPRIFRSGTAGPDTNIPTIVRAKNNELVTLSNPVHPEDQLVIYATGLGRTNPTIDAGLPGPTDPFATALIPAEVTLGGVSLPVSYAGLAPGEVGVYQINVSVPFNVPLGMSVPLAVNQGGSSTTLEVRVVR